MCKNKAVSGISEYYVVHAANSVFVLSNSSMLHRKWSSPCSSSSLSVKITWSNLSALLISSVSKVNVSRVSWKTYRSERWRLRSRLSGAVMGTMRCLKSFEPSYPPPTSICCWRTFGFLWSAPHMSHVAASVHGPSSARLALHFDCVCAQAAHHVTAQRRIFFFAKPRLCTVIAMATRVIQETSRLFISVTVCGVEIAENVPPATNYESVNSHWYRECLVEKHAVNVITFLFLCMTSSLQEARITATHRAHTHCSAHTKFLRSAEKRRLHFVQRRIRRISVRISCFDVCARWGEGGVHAMIRWIVRRIKPAIR